MKLSQLRGELLRHGVEEGLSNNEVLLIWHILDFDFDSKGVSWPGRKKLAAKMGFKNSNSVTNMITSLDEKGYLKRTERLGFTNKYDWQPLLNIFKKYVGEASFTNEGGLHSEMKGASFTNEGGLHSEMNQSSSNEASKENSSSKEDPPTPKNGVGSSQKKKIFDHSSREYVMSEYCAKQIKETHEKMTFSETQLQAGAKQFDLLLRKDGVAIEDVRYVLKNLPENEFWRDQLLSPAQIRNKRNGAGDVTKFQKMLVGIKRDKEFNQKSNNNHGRMPIGTTEDFSDLKPGLNSWD